MLKRQDLIEQFEDVVKQEIKNHQDSLLATNISLNEFRTAIAEIEKRVEKKIAKMESTLNSYEIENRKESKETEKSISDFYKEVKKFNWKIDSIEAELNKRFACLEGHTVKKETTEKIKAELVSFRKETCKTLENTNSLLSDALKSLSSSIHAETEKVKKELSLKPSHLSEMQKQLKKEIEACSIDSRCILKEVSAARKASFINEKKIENLYTLIQRMEGKLSKE